MSHKPKPRGYIDNAALETVIEVNETLAVLIPEALSELTAMPTATALLFQRIGYELHRQRSALAAMERIRAEYKTANQKT